MKTIKLFALTAILTGATFFSDAQEKVQKTPEQRAEKQTEMMSKKLDLSADQKTKIAEINLNTAKEISAIKSNTTLSKEDRKAQLNKTRELKHQEVKSILNSDQQVKLEKIREKREQKHEKRHNKKNN
jgi:protein CpxP